MHSSTLSEESARAMSRTQMRIVLILLALILVAATILSGLLTWWASAAGPQEPVPGDHETMQLLPVGCGALWGPSFGCDGASCQRIG